MEVLAFFQAVLYWVCFTALVVYVLINKKGLFPTLFLHLIFGPIFTVLIFVFFAALANTKRVSWRIGKRSNK